MALTLHYHPLSSFCWKVLIALYENGAPFEARLVNLGDLEAKAAFRALWPTAVVPAVGGKHIDFWHQERAGRIIVLVLARSIEDVRRRLKPGIACTWLGRL